MKPIYKFILHVTHNLFPLNEYSEGEIKRLMDQFKEEADDLNIQITDQQLKKYIERFDQLKNSPNIKEKDLRKYSLSQLIRLVTSSKGDEDEEDQTPDVVYHEGPITIWNGNKDENCITYGRGERWCITRGSWAAHRYSESTFYPTFYLAKNNDLSDSDKLSFIVIQVRSDGQYVLHDRTNSPHYPPPISFNELVSQASWLREIPNLKNILKYIPLSTKEKIAQIYSEKKISIREWIKLPFEGKKQYLVVRSSKSGFFSDINENEFISKYLPKYPQIANFIAITPNIIDSITLLKNLESFSNQDRRSVTANLRGLIATEYLTTDVFSFDVKKLLTILNKWDLKTNERIYITKDGSTIVKLILGDDIKMGIYQQDDDYPNVKLNQRTVKYFIENPNLDEVPFRNLLKLVEEKIVDKNIIDKVIEKAKTDPNSAIVIKDNIILDSNSFISYKIEGDSIKRVPFEDEEVQTLLASQSENEGFQSNIVKLINPDKNIPDTVDKDAFLSILKATPLNKRIIEFNNAPYNVLVSQDLNRPIILVGSNPKAISFNHYIFGSERNWRTPTISPPKTVEDFRTIFAYLRSINTSYDDTQIISVLRSIGSNYGGRERRREIIFNAVQAGIPMDEGSTFKPLIYNDKAYLVNSVDPRSSYTVSENSGKLVQTNISASTARIMLGGTPAALTPAAQGAGQAVAEPLRRRGRPAGVQNVRAPRPAAPTTGTINVSERMEEIGLDIAFLRLPRVDVRRLNVVDAVRVNPNGDRGAARRNNQLAGRGRVEQVLEIGPSKIYIIRLANGQITASINVQPGNRNYLLLGNENGNVAIGLNSPSDFVITLQQRNLAEHQSYITREYLHNHPEHLDEVKEILKQYLNKK